ncbi:MAG: protein translocase subunit SecD, partial [Candidatus Sungiibacteriota bacterium]
MKASSARLIAAGLLLLGIALGAFDAPMIADRLLARLGFGASPVKLVSLVSGFPYRLGLDIQGGTHLTYQADVSGVPDADQAGAMAALRDVIERRVNLFGVAEPLVVVERSTSASGGDWRLIAELAGIKDIGAAIKLIGETPYLEFKEERPTAEHDAIIAAQNKGERIGDDPSFVSTDLTGRFIQKANIDFDQTTFQPLVTLQLTSDGAKIFAALTKKNIGKQIAIFLDGMAISAPVVREEITGGRAQISGNFTPESAKVFAGRLNAGALPVPITLIGQQ